MWWYSSQDEYALLHRLGKKATCPVFAVGTCCASGVGTHLALAFTSRSGWRIFVRGDEF